MFSRVQCLDDQSVDLMLQEKVRDMTLTLTCDFRDT